MLLTEAGSADGPIPFAKLRKKSERGILPPCFTWLGGKDSVKRAPAPTLPTEGKKPQNPFSRKYHHRKPPPETCSGISSTAQRIPPRLVSDPFFNNLKEAQPPATRTPINKPQGTNQQTTRPRSTNCPASRTIPCHPRHRAASDIAVHCISHRNALHKPTQRTAFPEVVRWEQTRSTSSAPQHCAATRHTCTPNAKEAFRGLPDMPLPHIKTEGQPHG